MLLFRWTPLFISLTAGQTFPGFVPAASEPLVIEYTLGTSLPEFVSPAGRLLDISVVASPPKIGISPSLNLTNPPNGFLFLMVDPDVLLPNATNITTILHYIRGNYSLPHITSPITPTPLNPPTPDTTPPTPDINPPTADPGLLQNFTELLFPPTQAPLAVYQSPIPLSGQKHRYVFLLFEQPANFVNDCQVPDWKCIPEGFQRFLPARVNETLEGPAQRAGFNVSLFVEEAGLDPPIAGWFMEVENGNDAAIPMTNGTQLNVPGAGGNGSATATTTGSGSGSGSGSSATATATGSSTSQGCVIESRIWLIWCAVGLVWWYTLF